METPSLTNTTLKKTRYILLIVLYLAVDGNHQSLIDKFKAKKVFPNLSHFYVSSTLLVDLGIFVGQLKGHGYVNCFIKEIPYDEIQQYIDCSNTNL